MRTTFDLASGSTAALDNGASSGPTVLFVPGYTGSKEDFAPLLQPLGEAGFRAVAIDQRGQYESSWAQDDSRYRIESLAADVCELAAELGQSATTLHLVGHSFGGLVTRAAVITKPDLFGTLTLMGSGPSVLGGERGQVIDAMIWVLREHGMTTLIELAEERNLTDQKFLAQPVERQQLVRERFRANDPVGLRVMGTELRSVEDRVSELAAAPVPKLVMHGVDDDAWTPDIQRDMAMRLNAEYRVVTGAAHSPSHENPDGTLDVLYGFWSAYS
jgi:pimeloyl-ACP methyl ester carboxylesterase